MRRLEADVCTLNATFRMLLRLDDLASQQWIQELLSQCSGNDGTKRVALDAVSAIINAFLRSLFSTLHFATSGARP